MTVSAVSCHVANTGTLPPCHQRHAICPADERPTIMSSCRHVRNRFPGSLNSRRKGRKAVTITSSHCTYVIKVCPIPANTTKFIPKLKNISYEMCLKECSLTTLDTRRLRGDQIEVFKILNRYENIDGNIVFSVKKERTRGHGVTLPKKQCRLDIRTF